MSQSSSNNHYEIHYGTGRKTLSAYLIGFVLCLILTAASFYVVTQPAWGAKNLYLFLTGLAVAQLIIQVIFFLRVNAETPASRWNLTAFIFTLLIIVLIVGGSLWIMYNLDYHMMGDVMMSSDPIR